MSLLLLTLLSSLDSDEASTSLNYTTFNSIDWSLSIDKLDQRVNISLTLAKSFYTYNIRSLLLFTIVIILFVYKLDHSLNSTKIEFINTYNISRCLLFIS